MSTESALSKLAIDRGAAPLRRRRAWWKRWWVWALALLLVAGAAFVVVQRGRPTAVEFGTVTAAYPSQSLVVLNATGRVTAQVRASVSSKGTGRLEWLGVVEGQRVKQGDVIARLENRDVDAQRAQAAANLEAARANLGQGEAELADAQANLKRTRELAARNFISASAVDTAEAREQKARASIASLRAQIKQAQAALRVTEVAYEQTLIRAPFTGMVLTKSANVGDIVTPFSSAAGTTGAVVTMADMATLEVEADVAENAIARIAPGQPVEIQLDAYPELRLLGTVSRIVPTVDRSKATLLVKVKFEETDARVLPDMSAKTAFLSRVPTPEERKSVPAVRPEAVAKRDGRDVLLTVQSEGEAKGGKPAATDDGVVAVVPVTVGPKVGDLLRIDGAAPGTRVVLSPPEKLAAGARVTALRK
jgi:HlyD family secretion protein